MTADRGPHTPSVSVVTVAFGRRGHLGRQRASIDAMSIDVEHVVVDLGGPPIAPDDAVVLDRRVGDGAPLPLAAARNEGARRSKGDVIVFLDVDCIAVPDLAEAYRQGVGTRGGIWCGPVGYLPPSDDIGDWSIEALSSLATVQAGRPRFGDAPHRTDRYELFWSLSFAVTRSTFEQLGGFDERFVGYGAEDTDFGETARRAGVELWFDGRAGAFHQHHPVSSPPVEHVDSIVRNACVFHDKWGRWPMEGWLREFAARNLIEWQPESGRLVRTDRRIDDETVSGSSGPT